MATNITIVSLSDCEEFQDKPGFKSVAASLNYWNQLISACDINCKPALNHILLKPEIFLK